MLLLTNWPMDPARHRQQSKPTMLQHRSCTTGPGSVNYCSSNTIHFPVHHLSPVLCRGVMWEHHITATTFHHGTSPDPLSHHTCSMLQTRHRFSSTWSPIQILLNCPSKTALAHTISQAYQLRQPASGRARDQLKHRIKVGI
jgi:hypothetical protein